MVAPTASVFVLLVLHLLQGKSRKAARKI